MELAARRAYVRTRMKVPQEEGRPTQVPPRYRQFTEQPSGVRLTECLLCGCIMEGGMAHEQGCDQRYISLLVDTIRRLL